MNNLSINDCLLMGRLDQPGLLPHVEGLKNVPCVFEQDFGLPVLPTEPGIIMIRGPRQYGKSTWLEQQILETVKTFGSGSALYLNGDEIPSHSALFKELQNMVLLFSTTASLKRLFIDEITAVKDWEKAVKRASDLGLLRDVLLITTGSRATDLRRGVERLPGRKGKLSRTQYVFTPISYAAFAKHAQTVFGTDTLLAYLLSGGAPMAANAVMSTGQLPDYVMATVNDWIFGEIAAHGRSRAYLLAIFQSLYRMAGNPIGQAKLARESGLGNNTVAQGYVDLLADLMILQPAFPYDSDKKIVLYRKPCKYQFVSLLLALIWHPVRPRTVAELKNMGEGLGHVWEWAVAQEIWRRRCIENPEGLVDNLHFWQSAQREIDFVLPEQDVYIEVKSGKEVPSNFRWFLKGFPHKKLLVINQNRFDTPGVRGMTLEDFLLSPRDLQLI